MSEIKIILEMNIVYGHGGDETLMLDMFQPRSNSPLPVLMLIHGGAWTEGCRDAMYSHAIHAAKNGFAAICVSYRLAAETGDGKYINQFPAQIHDVKCAVRWLRAHAEKYNLDPDRIAALGHSSGGHLALMLATTAGDEFFEGNGGWSEYSSDIQAAVSWAGPTELNSIYYKTRPDLQPRAALFLGGTPERIPELYKIASPTSHVTPNTAPVLMAHGDLDDIVPLEQSRIMKKTLDEFHIPNELLYLKGQGHGYDDEAMKIIRQTQYEFIRKYMK